MNYCENECTPQGTRIYRGVVTSRYKKYCPAISVGFSGISDGLVNGNFDAIGSDSFISRYQKIRMFS